MKQILFTIVQTFFLFNFLGAQETPEYHPAQNFYELGETKHLIGQVGPEDLVQGPYQEWFDKQYKAFEAISISRKMKKQAKNLNVQIVFGTWCGDSKREVPKMIKLIEQWGFDESQIEYIAVSNQFPYYKQDLEGLVRDLNVHRVPTFIFYEEGQEIGRIVEHPITDMNTDVAQILLGYPTKAAYPSVQSFISLLEQQEVAELAKREEQILRYFKYHIPKSHHLNALGYVLLSQDKMDQSIYTFMVNSKIFPEDPNVFDSLGEAYFINKQYSMAQEQYEKVLMMDPSHDNAKSMLQKINTLLASN